MLASCAGLGFLGEFNDSQTMPANFKFMQYNIWNGWRHPSSDETQEDHEFSKENGIQFLKEQDADVIAYMEFRFFTFDDFEAMANEIGHDYFVKQKEGGYPVAISSKYPIKVIEVDTTKVGHGFLHVKTAGIHVFATHLSPGTGTIPDTDTTYDEKRQPQAKRLMESVTLLLEQGAPVIVTGDMNAESVLDTDFFSENSGYRQNFPTMDIFYKGGLKDSYANLRPAGEFKTTCSTESIPSERTRIDYILLSDSLMKTCSEAGIYNEDDNVDLLRISDHFPTYAIWNE